MNGFKIFIILVMIFGTIQTVSAQNNDSERELKISDDEKIILFAGFSVAVISIFLFLARDVILRKKTRYDKQEHDSKKDRTYKNITQIGGTIMKKLEKEETLSKKRNSEKS